MTDTAIIIPARLASQRFPRKLLHPVLGQPLILWTAQRVARVSPSLPLWFAVAERELAEVLQQAGYQTVMTCPDLASGTDRIAEANRQIGARFVINVQADEPLVTAAQIEALDRAVHSGRADIATLAIAIKDPAVLADPNKVKVLRREDGLALYFSRAPVPFCRSGAGVPPPEALGPAGACALHLGLYAYSDRFLQRFRDLPPGTYEQLEKLEQLRALERGFSIAVEMTTDSTVGVDVPEDLERLQAALSATP